jgi:uncharacterized protein (DUF362 family)
MSAKVFSTKFTNFRETLFLILKAIDIEKVLEGKDLVILKPNLTTDIPYPITTDPKFVESLLEILSKIYKGKIVIAEGSGGCDTILAFRKLGFQEISKKYKVDLIDLNREERIKLRNKNAKILTEIWLPKIVFEGFLISLPVPKDHLSAKFTCALKNQFGLYLASDFILDYDEKKLRELGIFAPKEILEAGWNKGELHKIGIDESIFDINLYKKPDLTICDARVGVRGGELGGEEFHIGKVFASFDPVALDSHLAKIFGYKIEDIKYLVFCHKKIGEAIDYQLVEI